VAPRTAEPPRAAEAGVSHERARWVVGGSGGPAGRGGRGLPQGARLRRRAGSSGLAVPPSRGLRRIERLSPGPRAAGEDRGAAAPDALALEGLAPPSHPENLGRLGDYELIDWVGQGGMGVVFRGFDAALNRFVAIKLLAPQWSADALARRRFTREAQAAAAVSHPHVVTIYAVSEWRGRPYLVMEYVSGSSLPHRIEDRRPLEGPEVHRVGPEVCPRPA